MVIFAFGGTEIVAVAAAETEDPERSIARAIRTVAWRILVFYIGSLSVIIAVVPWTSEALRSPFAAVLEAAKIPGAATAITLIAVIALLSALNANLYGASRMMYSLAQRREAPAVLGWTDPRQVLSTARRHRPEAPPRLSQRRARRSGHGRPAATARPRP